MPREIVDMAFRFLFYDTGHRLWSEGGKMANRRGLVLFVAVLVLVAGACTTGPGGGPPASTTTTTAAPQGQPTAVASASPTIGTAPYVVNFDSAGSNPGTGTGLTYSWDFGDSSPNATGPGVTHIYAVVGTFTASSP